MSASGRSPWHTLRDHLGLGEGERLPLRVLLPMPGLVLALFLLLDVFAPEWLAAIAETT